jgi:hypothetical protein
MTDNTWEELAKSPLDPDPNAEPSALGWLLPSGLAAIVGLLVGIFLLGAGGEGETPTTLAAPTSTTTTAAPPEADPEVPPGYVEIAGVGLDAVAAYSRGGSLFVVVNEATRSDQAARETAGFHGAEWVLDGDGISITATRSIRSQLAPGVTAIEFAGVTALPVSAPRLTVRQSTEMVVRTGCQGCGASSADEASGEVSLDGLARPYELTAPMFIDVGAGITLSIDHLKFTDEWGYLEWHIIDDNDARMRTSIRIVFVGTDDPGIEGTNPTQLIPQSLFGASQQNPTVANPDPFTRGGTQLLDRVGELVAADNLPASLLLAWTVEWQHPVGEPIELSLAGITDLGIID